MAKNKVTCPKCKSTNIAEVVYGLPMFDEMLEKDLEAGKIELGGCLVTGEDPTHHCNACGTDFGGKDDESY